MERIWKESLRKWMDNSSWTFFNLFFNYVSNICSLCFKSQQADFIQKCIKWKVSIISHSPEPVKNYFCSQCHWRRGRIGTFLVQRLEIWKKKAALSMGPAWWNWPQKFSPSQHWAVEGVFLSEHLFLSRSQNYFTYKYYVTWVLRIIEWLALTPYIDNASTYKRVK